MTPTDEPLGDDERRVLDGLMRPNESVLTRTLQSIASLNDLDESQARRVLRRLEQRTPPLVHREVDAALDAELWFTTPAAADLDEH